MTITLSLFEDGWSSSDQDQIFSRPDAHNTLDDIALSICESLATNAGVDPDRWADGYRRRRGWGTKKATLDEIGKSMGLTRERVRQVLKRIDEHSPLSITELPEPVAEAVAAIDWEDSKEEASTLIEDLGLTETPGSWTPAALIDLIRSCGHAEIATELHRRYEAGRQRRRITPETRKAIRSARSGVGTLDLRTVVMNGETLSTGEALAFAQKVYSQVVRVGNWVLCRRSDRSALETAAIQQLQIASVLSSQELTRGVFRIARRRNWPAPPEHIVIQLLEEAGLIRTTVGGYELKQTKSAKFEFVGNDAWLLGTLSAETPHALPADEVLRRAGADGLKRASINSHITYSPIVRRERGIVSLVGTRLTEEEIRFLNLVGKANRMPSQVRMRAHPRGAEIQLTMGTAYLTSGVVSIKKDLRSLIGNRRHKIKCCHRVSFGGQLGLSGVFSDAWYGWSPLFNHWLEEHGLEEGQTVRMLMSTEEVVCLEPWADSEDSAPGTSGAADGEVDSHSSKNSGGVAASPPSGSPPEADTPGLRPDKDAPSSSLEPLAQPGQPWPNPKGRRVLTLSPRHRDLLTQGPGTGAEQHTKKVRLNSIVGAQSQELTTEWPDIGPSGGRVRVEADSTHGTARIQATAPNGESSETRVRVEEHPPAQWLDLEIDLRDQGHRTRRAVVEDHDGKIVVRVFGKHDDLRNLLGSYDESKQRFKGEDERASRAVLAEVIGLELASFLVEREAVKRPELGWDPTRVINRQREHANRLIASIQRALEERQK